MNKIIKKELEANVNAEELRPDDIPDIDLYMDQILTLFESKMSSVKRFDDDKLMTKTMINNYSKAKVIEPVRGKKYSKEQIIQMLTVFRLKNNLTITEIRDLLRPLYDEEYRISEIYEAYLGEKDKLNSNFNSLVSKSFARDTGSREEKLLTILKLSHLSDRINNLIYALVDTEEENNDE